VDTHAAFVTRVPRVAPYMKLNNTPSPRVVGTGGSGAVLSVINIGVRIATRSLAQSYLRYVGESRGHSARSRERSPCFAVFRCARTSPDVRSSHPHRAAFIAISAIRHRYILPSVILNLLPRCLRERRRSPRIIRVRITFVVLPSFCYRCEIGAINFINDREKRFFLCNWQVRSSPQLYFL